MIFLRAESNKEKSHVIQKVTPPPARIDKGSAKRITTLAAALVATVLAAPVGAQVSGPIFIDPETGQQTYDGNTTDPDFSPYTPEQQNYDRNNLDTSGAGTASVGSLGRYEIQAPSFSVNSGEQTKQIGLLWTANGAGNVKMVEFDIMPGRKGGTRSRYARVVAGSCPPGESHNVYAITNVNASKLDLSQPVMLKKCSSLFIRYLVTQEYSFVIRLMGEMMMMNGGYVASFGPHKSAFNCGPPTWPSKAHQAAGHPPYAEWCDLSIWWRAEQ
ncbi:MAG: hypothetical protein OXC25_11265 [Thiotrichales bacterium]|nr:hypothetical protein [Thiotrichales bacterium]